MNIHRMWAIFVARNAEFFRDRASFGWNFAFPFLIIVGFGIIFNGREFKQFKVGVFPPDAVLSAAAATSMPEAFRHDRHYHPRPGRRQSRRRDPAQPPIRSRCSSTRSRRATPTGSTIPPPTAPSPNGSISPRS